MSITVDQIKTMIGESLKAQLEPFRTDHQSWIKAMLDAGQTQQEEKAAKGEGASRMIMALSVAGGDAGKAANYAKKTWGDSAEPIVKALSADLETAGGFLIRDQFAAEIIELLRAESIIRQFNPVMVPLDSGTLRMPKLTTGSSGGWIGENVNAPATEPVFGQVVMTAKKYASLVPTSNDLIRRAGAQTQTVIRDDLVGDIATASDIAYLRADGTAGQPKGLRFLALAANVLTANGTVNLANVTDDLGIMIQTLLDANVRMRRPGWIMEPRTWRYLITVRDGNGNFAFKPEMDGGTLFGFPFRLTSQLPRNLNAGADETELYLAEFADVVIGDTTGILISVSDSAAYHDGTNVVASFSLDQTVIRAIMETDIQVRHAESIVVLDAVTWGV